MANKQTNTVHTGFLLNACRERRSFSLQPLRNCLRLHQVGCWLYRYPPDMKLIQVGNKKAEPVARFGLCALATVLVRLNSRSMQRPAQPVHLTCGNKTT